MADPAAVLPEWPAFRAAVVDRDPAAGTGCTSWTTRELVAHVAAAAGELGRVLDAHLDGRDVPPTRGFAEREAPFLVMPWPELLDALDAVVADVADVVARGGSDPETRVPWTGRTMKVAWFGEHLRSELVLHRRDLVGDDALGDAVLAEEWMTTHSVDAVGVPLVGEDAATVRLRTPGRDDVVVRGGSAPAITLRPARDDADVVSDAAARVLLLWGRTPDDPARLVAPSGAARLGRARALLPGY